MKRLWKGYQIQITFQKVLGLVLGLIGLFYLFQFSYSVVAPKVRLMWARAELGESAGSQLENARSGLTYVLRPSNSLTFNVWSRSGRIRLLTNVNLPASWPRRHSPQDPIEYELKYSLLNRDQDVIHSGSLFIRSRMTEYVDFETGKTLVQGFYLDGPDLPADTRSAVLNLKSFGSDVASQTAQIRFTMEVDHPEALSIALRCYQEEMAPEHELETIWTRQSRSGKTRLARGNIYPESFLYPEEKLNAVRWEWRPSGPVGIQGKDYQLRTLYSQREIDGEKEEPETYPSGLFICPGLKATYPIPDKGAKLRITFQPWDRLPDASDRVQVLWDGKGLGNRQQWTFDRQDENWVLEEELGPGVLEFSALSDGAFSGQIQVESEAGEWIDTPPFYILSRAFLAEPDSPLVYKVHHAGSNPTPFRTDLRFESTAGSDLINPNSEGEIEAGLQGEVRFEWLNDQGELIGSEVRQIQAAFSEYDSPPGQRAGVRLSEKVRFYFNFPVEVAEFQIYPTTPAWTTVFNRPSGAKRRVLVPEDYDRSRILERQKTWFYIRPSLLQDLYEARRTGMIKIQLRPSEEDPALAQGDYDWTSYQPEGSDWAGRYLMLERDPEDPTRQEALSVVYQKLNLIDKKPVSLQIGDADGKQWTRPSLQFHYNPDGASGPLDFKLFRNGAQVAGFETWASSGEWRLPWIQCGSALFHIEFGSVVQPERLELWMNSIISNDAGRLKRFASQLGEEPLVFDYQKQTSGEEKLSLVFYSNLSEAEQAGARTGIEIEVAPAAPRPIGPNESFTLPSYYFDVQPNPNSGVIVLEKSGEIVGEGQTFFVPFEADLKPGAYRVSVRRTHGPSGYLTMYRLSKELKDAPGWKTSPLLTYSVNQSDDSLARKH